MALGWVIQDRCIESLTGAMQMQLGLIYPKNITTYDQFSRKENAGLEVLISQSVTSTGLITYSTRNNYFAFDAVSTNNTIQLTQCNTLDFTSDSSAYDYPSAALMWGFAFSSVFMLWYLAKNLGMIIDAVKRW